MLSLFNVRNLKRTRYAHLDQKKDLKLKIPKDYSMFLLPTKGGHKLVKKFTLS